MVMPTRIGPIPDGATVHVALGAGCEGAASVSAARGLAGWAEFDVSPPDSGLCSAVHADVPTKAITAMGRSDGMRTMISRRSESGWALASTVPGAV
jgi:hypothetical protein